jgi:AraC-like DNA-binding protein
MNSVVNNEAASVYQEYLPCSHLRRFVSCYWMSISTNGHAEGFHVVPDGCIDLLFCDNRATGLPTFSVVGTMTKPRWTSPAGDVRCVGVRFLPGAFGHFFRESAKALTDRIVSLVDLCQTNAYCMGEELINCETVLSRIRCLEDYLMTRLSVQEPDVILTGALAVIAQSRGDIRISDLSKHTACGSRQLHRKFESRIGVSPKTFCSIIRFRETRQILRQLPRPNLIRVALAAGYYDQAHFNHEFNRFNGSSPTSRLHGLSRKSQNS